MLLVTLTTVVGTIWGSRDPKGFFPNEDTGFLFITTEGAQDISFEALVERQKLVAEIIQADPNVTLANSIIGSDGATYGRIFVQLKPRKERKLTAQQVQRRVAPQARRRSRHQRLSNSFRTSRSAGGWPTAPVSSTPCRASTKRSCSRRRQARSHASVSFPACSTSTPILKLGSRRRPSTSIGMPRPASASPSNRCARPSTAPSAAAGLDHLHARPTTTG